MLSVFIKELYQYRHCTKCIMLLVLSLLMALLSAAMLAAGHKTHATIFCAAAGFTAGIYQLSIMAAAGTRWKNENGDGTLDIILTTPVSPLKTACAKTAAATLFCLLAFPSLVIVKANFPVFMGNFHKLNLLMFFQTLALNAIVLGCSTFQNKKKKSFDWLIVLTVMALTPVVSMFCRKVTGSFSNPDFITSYAALAATAAFGISLAVCGASPKVSDRAMPLKITTVLSAVILPVIYSRCSYCNIREAMAFSLFIAATGIICSSIGERVKQTPRVLANKISRVFFLFSTGAANSFLLFVVLGVTALYFNNGSTFPMESIFAKTLFYSGICVAFKGRDARRSALIPLTAICTILLIALLIYIPAAPPVKEAIVLLLPWAKSSLIANTLIAAAGILFYLPVCINTAIQYITTLKENKNNA